jgi:hypothetical protein
MKIQKHFIKKSADEDQSNHLAIAWCLTGKRCIVREGAWRLDRTKFNLHWYLRMWLSRAQLKWEDNHSLPIICCHQTLPAPPRFPGYPSCPSPGQLLIPSHFFFFFDETEFELRALHLLGKPSTARATPPALLTLVIFQIGSYTSAWDHSQTMILAPMSLEQLAL